MNEERVVVAEETPAIDQAPPKADAPLSILEHAEQFDPKRDKTADAEPESPQPPLAANATPAERAAHHSEQQRRDKANGQFKDGRVRHRARSQQATAADAPRIQELNRKLKEQGEELARLRSQPPAPNGNGHALQTTPTPTPVAQPQTQATPPQPQRRWLGDVKNDPEPQEKDFGGDPMKYLDARYEWLARGVNRFDRHEAQTQQQEFQRSASWAQRVEAAAKDRADFIPIALQTHVPWREGSKIDEFIDHDDNGALLLYHLNSNLHERDALMQMNEFQQTKFLALLSQRLDPASTTPQSAQAGITGSVAGQKVRFMPPRPPNPVRTEAQRAEKTTAPTDGSLGVMAHAKRFAPR